jgi:hypothetical protein
MLTISQHSALSLLFRDPRGRELLREPYWALKTQQELAVEPSWPISYGLRGKAAGEVGFSYRLTFKMTFT